jgi:autotransporter-associated beta strand protein
MHNYIIITSIRDYHIWSKLGEVMSTRHRTFIAALFMLTVCFARFACPTKAATYTWDASGNGSAFDGLGTWSTTSAYWWNSATDSPWTATGTDDAIFGVGGGSNPYTVTLGSSISAAGIQFANQNYTIAPDAGGLYGLTIGANGVNANAPATIGAPITLSGVQTWSNASNGMLAITGNVNNGGNTLTIAGNGSSSFSGTIHGSGGLTMSGTGTTYLSGVNSYSGPTTINAGLLSFRGAGSLPAATAITLAEGNLEYLHDGAGNNGTIAAGNNITVNTFDIATINVGNFATFNTGNTVAFGTLSVGDSNNTFLFNQINFTGANGYGMSFAGMSLSNGSFPLLNPSTSVTIAGDVTNQGGNPGLQLDGTSTGNVIRGAILDGIDGSQTQIFKTNSSIWSLNGANTYSAFTEVDGGTLVIGGSGSLGGGSYSNYIQINDASAAFVMNTSSNQIISGGIFGVGAFYQLGSGSTTLLGAIKYKGTINIGGGTLALGTNTTLNLIPKISLSDGATFDVTALGAAGFTLSNTQTLTAFGNTNMPGTMTVNGTVLPGGTTSFGTLNAGALTVNPGAKLSFNFGGGSQGLIKLSSANGLNLNGGNLYVYQVDGVSPFNTPGTYPIISYSGTQAGLPTNLTVADQDPSLAYNLVTNGTGLALNIIAPNQWSGGGSPSVNWSTGANWASGQAPSSGTAVTFTGNTGLSNVNDISNLQLAGIIFDIGASAFNLSGNSIQLAGAISNFSFASATQTIGMNIGLVGGNYTVNAAEGDIVLSGAISDGGAGLGLLKTGGGKLTLGGANTFSGSVNLLAGALLLANSAAMQNATLTGGTGTAVGFDSGVASHAFTIAALSGSENVSLTDNGSNAVALTDGGNNASTAYSGTMSGLGSLTKIGSGALTLNSANTFSGNTLINGGTIAIGNSLALQNSTFDTSSAGVLSSGTLTSVSLGGLINGGALSLTNGTGGAITLSVGNNGINTAYSGNMSGSGALTKVGSGQLVLTGSNSYSRATSVNGGTLQFQGVSAIPSGGTINVNIGQGPFPPTLSIRQDGSGSNGTITPNTTLAFPLGNVGSATIDVGNNGSGSSGNTVSFGTVGVATAGSGTNGLIINFTASNGYKQSYAALNLNSAGGPLTLNPTSTTLSIGRIVSTRFNGNKHAFLDLDGTSTGNVIGPIADAGGNTQISVTKSNASVWTLNGSNTFSGPTTISGGTLIVGGSGNLSSGTAAASAGIYTNSISNSGALIMNTTTNQTFSGIISGPGTFTQSGAGSTLLTAANTFNGPTNILAGTLALGQTASIAASQTITLGNGATLDVSAQGNNFHLAGGQTLLGSGNYNISGAMTANASSLILPGGATSAGTLSIGGLTVAPGSAISYDLGSGQDLINVPNSGGLSLTGGGVYLYQDDGATPFVTPGTYELMKYSGSANVTTNLSVLNPTSSLSYAIAVTGGSVNVTIALPNVIWTGGGDPAINWSNTANWSSSHAPTSGNLIVFDGFMGLNNTNDLPSLNVKGITFRPTAGAFNLSGNSIQLSDAVINNSTSTQSIGLNLGLSGGGQTINAAVGGIVVAGAISDGGAGYGLTIAGSAGVTLAAANTYSGPTSVAAGVLNLGHNQAAQNSTVNMAGGSLAFASGVTAPTFANLTGAGNIALTTAAFEPVMLSVGSNNQSTTYSGQFSGQGGFSKQGAGVLTLTSTQSYSGATNISGGSLVLQNNADYVAGGMIGANFVTPITGPDGAPGAVMSNWNTFNGYNNGSGQPLNNNLGLPSGVNFAYFGNSHLSTSSAHQILQNNLGNPHSPTTATVSNIPFANYTAYVYFSESSPYDNQVLTVDGTNYYYTATDSSTFTQVTNTMPGIYPVGNYVAISGLTGGSLTVSASNLSYNQSWSNIAAVEIVNTFGGNVLPVTTPVTISGGASLVMANNFQTIASLASTDGMGSKVILNGGALTITGPAITTFDGAISDGTNAAGGGGSLILQGGTLTLSGTNTYTGGTTVEGGELIVTNNEALADGSSLTVGTASMFAPIVPAPVASPAVAAVPEPGTLALAAVGCIVCLQLRSIRRNLTAHRRPICQSPREVICTEKTS